jgi:antitoxin (DNA-binding transcriptional repressor) of toxin-antitoxin stability system
MRVTATEFRKDLFKLLGRALEGEDVEVVYKGSTVRIAANGGHSKLARAKRQHALVSHPDAIVHTDKKLMARLEAQWRKDWRRL